MSTETYGRYQLVKKLATGGMAQIFLALQEGVEGFRKTVVLKRILPHLAENDDFITMFLDEARIAARLNHPNIAQIFDLGAHEDSYFIAMEYVHGEDVRRVWKQAERMGREIPVPLVCRLVIEACSGLDYAHKKADGSGRPLDIVHRDVSPQNIIVSFEGYVKIVDFGIAKAADQATITRSGVLKGKYSYMSPEQAAGQHIDCRSDVFAIGVVLYELLTGVRLFKRTNDLQTLNAVMECAVEPPSKVNPRCPTDLDPIVLKALAKDVGARYPEARALAADLERWLLGNQHVASTAELGAFMQELYAERLAQEAEEGRLQVLELDGSRVNEPATPASQRNSRSGHRSQRSAPAGAYTRSQKSAGAGREPSPGGLPSPRSSSAGRNLPLGPARSAPSLRGTPRVPAGATSAERPGLRSTLEPPVPLEPLEPAGGPGARTASRGDGLRARLDAVFPETRRAPEPSLPTETFRDRAVSGARSRLVRSAVFVLAVAAALAFGWRYFNAPPEVVLSVRTEPWGAQLLLDGQPIPGCPAAPCRIEGVSPGLHRIEAELAGYRRAVEVRELPPGPSIVLMTLEREPRAKPSAPEETDAGAPEPARPALVLTTITSSPSGAAVRVDGAPRGVTPLVLSLPARSVQRLELSLEGYKPISETLDVGEGGTMAQSFYLQPLVEPLVPDAGRLAPPPPPRGLGGTVRTVVRRPPPPDAARPEPQSLTGTVRFTVTPWAFVECPPYDFKDTPFGPQQMAVGEYVCTFRNPDLGKTVQRRVRVEPGSRTPTVSVVLSDE